MQETICSKRNKNSFLFYGYFYKTNFPLERISLFTFGVVDSHIKDNAVTKFQP